MSETPSLTDRALGRLRQIAAGNGLAPEVIQLVDKTEEIYTLTGKLRLTPSVDVQVSHYVGGARGKGRKGFPNRAALHQAVESKKSAFTEASVWLSDAVKEMEALPSQGWGLESAKVPLPQHKEVFVASEICPSCHGQKQIFCDYCQGTGRQTCTYCVGLGKETCPNCFGRGTDPVHPKNPCTMCQGMRQIQCRYCNGLGWNPCPSCQGRGGTVCADCKGEGAVTEEAVVTGCAEAVFRMDGREALPSGLLRGLDRLGIANLGKGYATIKMSPPKDDKEDSSAKTTLTYVAQLPFAELKLRFGGAKIYLISAFGSRCALLDCPPFLDLPLKSAREVLVQAAAGKAPLDKAVEKRAIKDALMLELAGKGGATSEGFRAFKRLYPVGLSAGVIREILENVTKALLHQTRVSRIFAATGLFLLAVFAHSGFFLTAAHENLVQVLPRSFMVLFYLFWPLLWALGGWFGLERAERWLLRRRYPQAMVGLRKNLGKIGYSLPLLILMVYAVSLFFASYRPWWLLRLLG